MLDESGAEERRLVDPPEAGAERGPWHLTLRRDRLVEAVESGAGFAEPVEEVNAGDRERLLPARPELLARWEGAWDRPLRLVEAAGRAGLAGDPGWRSACTPDAEVLVNRCVHPLDQISTVAVERGVPGQAAAISERMGQSLPRIEHVHERFPERARRHLARAAVLREDPR